MKKHKRNHRQPKRSRKKPKSKKSKKPPKPPPPQGPEQSSLRKITKKIAWALGVPFALYGAYEALDNLDLLPTVPEIQPNGSPRNPHAFTIRFSVSNRSKIFPLGHTRIDCNVNSVFYSRRVAFIGGPKLITVNEEIGTDKILHVECPFERTFNMLGRTLESANITFVAKYDLPWPWPDQVTKTFTWDGENGQWLEGELR